MERKIWLGVIGLVLLLVKVGSGQTQDSTNAVDSLQDFVVNAKLNSGEYSIEKFSKFAQVLIELESGDRKTRLKDVCKLCDLNENHINGVIVCQLLFEPQRPLLGSPRWIGKPTERFRVLEPIVFVNSTPILAVSGYSFSGVQQTSSEFLEQCLNTRSWVEGYKRPSVNQIKQDLAWYMECFGVSESDIQGKPLGTPATEETETEGTETGSAKWREQTGTTTD